MANIFLMGDLIVIKHKLMGNAKEAVDLGPMSMELALWLEYKLTESEMRDADDASGLAGIQYYLHRDPYLAGLTTRSQLAAMRGYKPKLAEHFDYVTPLGMEKAKKARIVIKEINETYDNIVYDPSAWKDSDEMFITAGIHRRIIKMLEMLDKAIKEAKRRYDDDPKENSTFHYNFTESAEGASYINNSDLEESKRASDEKRKERQEATNSPLISDLRDVVKKTELPETFEAITFNGDNLVDDNRCWVPTATFGQRARNDLNVLVRYGLVDLKNYNIGSTGRPKHIIKVSTVGHTVLRDLEEMRLL